MEEKHLSHSVGKLGYHLVWCPKFRHPVLVGAVEVELKNILYQSCVAYGWDMLELVLMPDNVHAFVQASPDVAPSEIVKTLKSISAVHLFNKFPQLKGQKFWGTGLWSSGAYYGSVGEVDESVVRKYVQEQRTK